MSTAFWLTIFLLLLNAFFVGSEFAAMAARGSQLRPLAEAGRRRAKVGLDASGQMGSPLAGAPVGITLCSVLRGGVVPPAPAPYCGVSRRVSGRGVRAVSGGAPPGGRRPGRAHPGGGSRRALGRRGGGEVDDAPRRGVLGLEVRDLDAREAFDAPQRLLGFDEELCRLQQWALDVVPAVFVPHDNRVPVAGQRAGKLGGCCPAADAHALDTCIDQQDHDAVLAGRSDLAMLAPLLLLTGLAIVLAGGETAATIGAAAARTNGINTAMVYGTCLLYTSPSPRDRTRSRMPSSA